MATVTHAATAIWTTAAGNKNSNTFSPAIGDLLVVVAPATRGCHVIRHGQQP